MRLNNIVEKSVNMKTNYLQTPAMHSPMREASGENSGINVDIGGNSITLSGFTRDACTIVLN